MTDESTQQQEAASTKPAKAKAGTGNVILDIATSIENLSKTKALNLASSLADDIEANYLRLGGVLKAIYENSWFEGYETFSAFVTERFGFAERKARYLIEIYTHLVDKQIEWDKVKGLGWTKLKDLAKILTPENTDEWVAKASTLTVAELQKLLKEQEGGKEGSSTTSSDSVTMKFKCHADQVETIQSALGKAKAEVGTEHDNVALEMICTGYLGGSVQAAAQPPSTAAPSLKELMAKADDGSGNPSWQIVLALFGEVFPNVDITVDGVN